jgi:hypothetical protein
MRYSFVSRIRHPRDLSSFHIVPSFLARHLLAQIKWHEKIKKKKNWTFLFCFFDWKTNETRGWRTSAGMTYSRHLTILGPAERVQHTIRSQPGIRKWTRATCFHFSRKFILFIYFFFFKMVKQSSTLYNNKTKQKRFRSKSSMCISHRKQKKKIGRHCL